MTTHTPAWCTPADQIWSRPGGGFASLATFAMWRQQQRTSTPGLSAARSHWAAELCPAPFRQYAVRLLANLSLACHPASRRIQTTSAWRLRPSCAACLSKSCACWLSCRCVCTRLHAFLEAAAAAVWLCGMLAFFRPCRSAVIRLWPTARSRLPACPPACHTMLADCPALPCPCPCLCMDCRTLRS